MSALLEEEYKVYRNRREEFIRSHCNKFVLIKNKEVVDFFCSYEKALVEGLNRFGNVPFFIREVRKKDESHILHQRVRSR